VTVPLTGGWSAFSPFIALALIGALALVLRWTFRTEDIPDRIGSWPPPSDAPQEATIEASPEGSMPGGATRGARSLKAGPPTESEDFGLLGVVAVVETPDVAQQVRVLLAEAGIRATISAAPQGRIRVLVFEDDVARARRVVGWPV
jgi:hypothetical protein